MCTKYILETCEERITRTEGMEDRGNLLKIPGWHYRYLGDAGWSIATRTNADGERRIEVTVFDYHNIEKSLLYLQHTGNHSVPALAILTRELLSNLSIPETLVRSRFNSLRKHGYLSTDGQVISKGYEALMMLRSPGMMHRGKVPEKLLESIRDLGADLLRACEA